MRWRMGHLTQRCPKRGRAARPGVGGTSSYQGRNSRITTYEECQRLLEVAAEGVGCTKSALPRVLRPFGTVPKHKEGGLIPNPAYDEEEFKALPKKQQTCQRKHSMKYLQGPNGSCSAELVVAHEFLEAHPPDFYLFRILEPVMKLQSGQGNLLVAKLRQHHEEEFIALIGGYPT